MNNPTTPQAAQAAVSQDDINAAVWAACDTFRGTVDRHLPGWKAVKQRLDGMAEDVLRI